MEKSIEDTLSGKECIKAIGDFACEVRRNTWGVCPVPDPLTKSIPVQVARQMEPVSSFMDTLLNMPLIGAILFKTT